MSRLAIKRIYDARHGDDGLRIFVDRLWPRGLSRAAAHFDLWLKEVAPSSQLRKWYAHDPKKWPAFQKKYLSELVAMGAREIWAQRVGAKHATLLFAASDPQRNNAVVLKAFLDGDQEA